MRPEIESDIGALQLCWVRGRESAVLELLFDVVLVLTLSLFWCTWPGILDLWVCAALAFGLLLVFLLRLWRHLSRSGQEESLEILSQDLSGHPVIVTLGNQRNSCELSGWMWWSPVCVVLQIRTHARQSKMRLLVIWRHRVGEAGYRLLRRWLNTCPGRTLSG